MGGNSTSLILPLHPQTIQMIGIKVHPEILLLGECGFWQKQMQRPGNNGTWFIYLLIF